MASVSHNSRWMLPLKVGVLSFSVLCLAAVLRLSLPTVTDIAYSELPSLWSLLMTWLRPPYLYVVINGIIITIVATSKLHHHKADAADSLPLEIPPLAVVVPPEYDVYTALVPELEKATAVVVEDKMMMTTTTTTAFVGNGVDGRIGEDDVAVTRIEKKISEEFPVYRTEKPPVSGRIGHRKAAKSVSEGGRALRVSKPKRQETLESTWKTITEGRPMPLTRHLRKSDTWETHGHHHTPQDPKMTKSDTFNDPGDRHFSTAATPGLGRLRKEPSGSWKLKKEPSLGQDELNKRVEAFINKFNEDMRIQRQESLNQYMEMINRGAH